MSDHLPIYVWGRAARGALMLAGQGWGLGATMHADSLDEALDSLRSSLGATDADLAGLTIYLQYSAYLTPTGMYRRVDEARHTRLDADGGLDRKSTRLNSSHLVISYAVDFLDTRNTS